MLAGSHSVLVLLRWGEGFAGSPVGKSSGGPPGECQAVSATRGWWTDCWAIKV